MTRAGARVPSANRITLLRDADGDGIAEIRSVFLENLNSPFGMALIGDTLYVANTDAIVAFAYVEGATGITGPGPTIAELPAGPINHHWTKDIIASPLAPDQADQLHLTPPAPKLHLRVASGTDKVKMRRTPPDHRGVIQGRHLQIGAEPNDRAGRRAKAQKARLHTYCPDQQDQKNCGGQHPFGFHIRATGRKTRPISTSPPPR